MSVLVIKKVRNWLHASGSRAEDSPDIQNSLYHTAELVWSLLRNTNIGKLDSGELFSLQMK